MNPRLVIFNCTDRPCAEFVCLLTDERCRYVGRSFRLELPARPTSVQAFGVVPMIWRHNDQPYLLCVHRFASMASYEDGTPRRWQPRPGYDAVYIRPELRAAILAMGLPEVEDLEPGYDHSR